MADDTVSRSWTITRHEQRDFGRDSLLAAILRWPFAVFVSLGALLVLLAVLTHSGFVVFGIYLVAVMFSYGAAWWANRRALKASYPVGFTAQGHATTDGLRLALSDGELMIRWDEMENVRAKRSVVSFKARSARTVRRSVPRALVPDAGLARLGLVPSDPAVRLAATTTAPPQEARGPVARWEVSSQERDEVVNAVWLRSIRAIVVTVVVVLVVVVLLFGRGDASTLIFMVVLYAVLLGFMIRRVHGRTRRTVHAAYPIGFIATGEATEKGLVITSATGASLIPWDRMDKVKVGDAVVSYRHSGYRRTMIPRKVVPDEALAKLQA